jgi:hypothetical protein
MTTFKYKEAEVTSKVTPAFWDEVFLSALPQTARHVLARDITARKSKSKRRTV